jgi:hypothetical protein
LIFHKNEALFSIIFSFTHLMSHLL